MGEAKSRPNIQSFSFSLNCLATKKRLDTFLFRNLTLPLNELAILPVVLNKFQSEKNVGMILLNYIVRFGRSAELSVRPFNPLRYTAFEIEPVQPQYLFCIFDCIPFHQKSGIFV